MDALLNLKKNSKPKKCKYKEGVNKVSNIVARCGHCGTEFRKSYCQSYSDGQGGRYYSFFLLKNKIKQKEKTFWL